MPPEKGYELPRWKSLTDIGCQHGLKGSGESPIAGHFRSEGIRTKKSYQAGDENPIAELQGQ